MCFHDTKSRLNLIGMTGQVQLNLPSMFGETVHRKTEEKAKTKRRKFREDKNRCRWEPEHRARLDTLQHFDELTISTCASRGSPRAGRTWPHPCCINNTGRTHTREMTGQGKTQGKHWTNSTGWRLRGTEAVWVWVFSCPMLKKRKKC